MSTLPNPPASTPAPISSPCHLYAVALGADCKGHEECHWCASPCGRAWLHDDPYPMPFSKGTLYAKRPLSPWICRGCWLLRRQRVTVHYLGGGFRDGRSMMHHSLWVTKDEAIALHPDPEKRKPLYDLLLNPPRMFCLSLLKDSKDNLLHTSALNNHMEILATTPLTFTLDRIPYTYTIYELQHAMRHGEEGKEPGVRILLQFLGTPPAEVIPPAPPEPKRKDKVGKPPTDRWNEQAVKKLIRASGS